MGPVHPPLRAKPAHTSTVAADRTSAVRPKHHRPIPRELRKEVTEFARTVKQRYSKRFRTDRELKTQLSRLLRNLLPPKPRRRGRPGIPSVTEAIRLRRKLKLEYPTETPRQIWGRVYPITIPGYDNMSELDQESARGELRQRVVDRLRKRSRRKCARKILAELSIS